MISLLLFGLLSLSLRAQWSSNEIDIDGTPVKLVLPTEYLKAPDDDGGLIQSRRILKDYLIFANYRSPKPWQFVQVQMHMSQRDYRYTRESFLASIAQVKAQLPSFDSGEFRTAFQKRIDEATAADAKLINPVLFPISSESERYFIIPMLMGMNLGPPANRRTVVGAAVISISLNGRMLMLQVYTPYENKDSVSQVSALAKEIAERTLAANK